MAIRYVDMINGDDANDGSTWALAKKTVSFSAAQIAAGDTIKISKTPDPLLPIYLDAAGAMSQTPPSTVDHVAQVLAIPISATIVDFNPSYSQVVYK